MHSNTIFKILAATILLTGCASSPPPSFTAGVNQQTKKADVADAQSQRVKGHPSIRMNVALLDQLNLAIAEADLIKARALADAVLAEAHDLANHSASNEMLRLSNEKFSTVAGTYFAAPVTVDVESRDRLIEEYRRESDLEFWLLRQQIAKAKDLSTLRLILNELKNNTETSAKFAGRAGRQASGFIFAPAAAAIRESVHDDEATCQPDADFEGVTRYMLTQAPAALSLPHADLLIRYAPTFLQETLRSPKYDPAADRLGIVIADNEAKIDVDTSIPAIYGYTRTVLLSGQPHIQLTYVLWYPEHPKLKSGIDAEAGHIDGATVRITLDSASKPAIFETLNNCGCHHRLYPSEAVENAARQTFGTPEKGKSFCIERDTDKYDIIIPALVRPQDGARAFVRCRAGSHAVVDVNFNREKNNEPIVATQFYQLRDYDELERLKTPNGPIVSMFEPNGLVRGAGRFEGDVFNSLGMLSAGQPRQRGTQLVQWDAYDFDDPHLYEKTIRLPKGF